MNKAKKNEFSYEAALQRLEEILVQVQDGQIPLDKFEETLKEAHDIIHTSKSYLRKLSDVIKEYDEET